MVRMRRFVLMRFSNTNDTNHKSGVAVLLICVCPSETAERGINSTGEPPRTGQSPIQRWNLWANDETGGQF